MVYLFQEGKRHSASNLQEPFFLLSLQSSAFELFRKSQYGIAGVPIRIMHYSFFARREENGKWRREQMVKLRFAFRL